MFNLHKQTPRRKFLGTLAAGAAATVGLTRIMKAAPAGALVPEVMPYSPGLEEFDAWLGKIKGKYAQVFDSPFPEGGLPYAWARVYLMTNKAAGVTPDDMTTVLILRHDSIPLGLTHDLWPKYKFSEKFKIMNPVTKEPFMKNPFYQAKDADLPLPGMTPDALLNDGVLIGMCDMALTHYSHQFGKEMNMDPEAIKKDWVAGIIPGIQLVPSGVLAVNRAQKAGCTYCYAG